jgi:phosphatidylserine/phosphatidylglycerophosphate/cardiolipin synthase-like enzyme
MVISIHHRLRIVFPALISGILVLSIACVSNLDNIRKTEHAGSTPSLPKVTPASWYAVYFSEPDGVHSKTLLGGPDKDLASAIQSARVSVDVAVLRLDLWSIRDALIDAHRRGVSVRMVIDSDYLNEEEIQDLIKAGIPIVGDRGEGTMHNKFVVIDRKQTWSGSMNFTISDTYRNNNNLLRIDSSELAENYTKEFEEMFIDGLFGAGSPANTPHPIIDVQGVEIESCFSPDDGCQALLEDLAANATQSIRFLVFSFTSDDLAEAILERADAGVSVSGVFDEGQYHSNIGTEYDKLRSAGLEVHLSNASYKMHHKAIIIDDRIVVTGSYNLTYFAENRNDENLLIIHSPEIAGLYQEEFLRLFDQSQ